MKKYICILAGAALFVACEQKTETVNPPAKTENNTTIVNPSPAGGTTKSEKNTTIVNPPSGGATKTESSTSTTTSTPSGN
jgi:PBP1b-binding outer membrane lipoprotein LpoB